MHRSFFSLCLFTVASACNNRTTNSDRVDTPETATVAHASTSTQVKASLESKIIDTILSLPEVQDRAKYIDEQTNGARQIKVWFEGGVLDSIEQESYGIHVGEDNGANLVTHFRFVVYPDSMRIMYYDVVDDEEIGLEVWRNELREK